MGEQKSGFRRTLSGTVVSDKRDKTVTVEVILRTVDKKYKKYLRERRRYHAHDASNEYVTGDRVEISEHRPISKTKRWVVTKMIAASKERRYQ
jgi:small subunit ribosomal protein S17